MNKLKATNKTASADKRGQQGIDFLNSWQGQPYFYT
jgi:hypothetical protein